MQRWPAKRLPLWAVERAKKFDEEWYTPLGKANRVMTIGRIVSLFKNEEGTYVSFVVDDSTGTVRVKCFRDLAEAAKELNPGDAVAVVGTVREFGGEVYINCEVLRRDVNLGEELLWMVKMWKILADPARKKEGIKTLLRKAGIITETFLRDEWEIDPGIIEEMKDSGEVYRPEEGKIALTEAGGAENEVEDLGEEMADDLGEA